MTYRVIAFDLDGTLLNNKKEILPRSLKAIRQAREKGVKVLIVTGRHHCAIHPIYQTLDLDTPAICCNGTYLYDYPNKRVLTANPLHLSQAQQLLGIIEQQQIPTLLYVDDDMVYQTYSAHVERFASWAKTLPEHQRPSLKQVANLKDFVSQAENIWKIATTHTDYAVLDHLVTEIDTNKIAVECERSWEGQLDIAQAGNSKGARLRQWVESQGLSMEQVIAFGDNHNDISMLQAAGLGIAMGNSDQRVQHSANLVIEDNNQDGIAKIIETYVLNA